MVMLWFQNGYVKQYHITHNTPSPQASAGERNMYLKFNGNCLKTKTKYYLYPGLM